MALCTAFTIVAAALAVNLVFRLIRRARGGCRGGGGGGGGLGFGRHRGLRWIFRSLDTTPGQEKVIRSALEEAWIEAREARAAARDQRGNLAAALRSEGPDAASFDLVRTGARAAYDRAEIAIVAAFKRIHEILDPMQRERLARIVDGSASPWQALRSFGGGGPYRGGSGPVSL